MSIGVGDQAPDFTLPGTGGTSYSLSQYRGAPVVLVFYPGDDTPVCTKQLCKYNDELAQFTGLSAQVLGVSAQSVASHEKFSARHGFKFPLLADEDKKVSDLYGMIHPNSLNNLTVRSVFIIDPNKKLRLQITYPASTGRNFQEILRVIDSLQLTDHHQVATPVNWKDGDDCVVVPSITTDEARNKFPKGVTEIKPYLRMTPQPNK